MENKQIVVKCTDHCFCMAVDKFEDDGKYYITFYKNYEKSFWYRLKEALKYILKTAPIFNNEIILSEKEFNKIRKFERANLRY